MKGIVNISAWLDVSNDCVIQCRINDHREIEFTFGTWQGSVEMGFESYALERFVELANTALSERFAPDPNAARPVLAQPTT